MKRTFIIGLAVLLAGVGLGVGAKNLEKEPVQAKEIKIHKKQILSDQERKALDAAKGKPAGVADKKVTTPTSWATGELGAALPEGGQRYAIVAGLANYSGTVNDLCVAEAETTTPLAWELDPNSPAHYCQDYDSVNMKNALVSRFGFLDDVNFIIHLRDGQATKQAILDAMKILDDKVTSNDEVVFFFSGHGVTGKLPGDKEALDEALFTYDNNYLWDDELKTWAANLGANRVVMAFDICKAGGMNDAAGKNRVLAMSSGETQSSWTYTLGGAVIGDNGERAFSEGLFSHSFVLDGMFGGLADGWNLKKITDEKVAVEEAFSYAYPLVKDKQTPVLNDQFSNDLLLNY